MILPYPMFYDQMLGYAQRLPAGKKGVTTQIKNLLIWRLPTLPFRVPSVVQVFTAVFGMRTGVTPASSHQITRFFSIEA